MGVVQASEIERFYREAGDRLWWSLLAYTGDRELASDATSEAFARALLAADTIRDPAAWIWRVAFRVATADLRRARREAAAQPEARYEIDERALAVTMALAHLSVRQRAVIVLFYLEDRPTKEIASLLDITAATVSVHLHRARRRLRSILEDEDD